MSNKIKSSLYLLAFIASSVVYTITDASTANHSDSADMAKANIEHLDIDKSIEAQTK